jgi:hypothetical protein
MGTILNPSVKDYFFHISRIQCNDASIQAEISSALQNCGPTLESGFARYIEKTDKQSLVGKTEYVLTFNKTSELQRVSAGSPGLNGEAIEPVLLPELKSIRLPETVAAKAAFQVTVEFKFAFVK